MVSQMLFEPLQRLVQIAYPRVSVNNHLDIASDSATLPASELFLVLGFGVPICKINS